MQSYGSEKGTSSITNVEIFSSSSNPLVIWNVYAFDGHEVICCVQPVDSGTRADSYNVGPLDTCRTGIDLKMKRCRRQEHCHSSWTLTTDRCRPTGNIYKLTLDHASSVVPCVQGEIGSHAFVVATNDENRSDERSGGLMYLSY